MQETNLCRVCWTIVHQNIRNKVMNKNVVTIIFFNGDLNILIILNISNDTTGDVVGTIIYACPELSVSIRSNGIAFYCNYKILENQIFM